MKSLIRASIVTHLLISSTAFALNSNPVQGIYLGLLAGISHGPENNQKTFYWNNIPITASVSYDSVGAGGGGVFGYKISNFRGEIEVLYNRISTGPLQLDKGNYSLTIQNENIASIQNIAIGYRGSSSVTTGLFNLYYDIFTQDSHTDLFPYVGIGIGESYIKDINNIVSSSTDNSIFNIDRSFGAPTMQGIVGAGFFMDDFAWIGMDVRYTSTLQSYTQLNDKRYSLIALMFNINFALDKGAINVD